MNEKLLENDYERKYNFERIKTYYKIYELAFDVPKISNLAYFEIMKSFLKIIYKYDGLNFIKEKILSKEIDDELKAKLLVYLLPIDREFAMKTIKSLSKSENQKVRESVFDILTEKYTPIDEFVDNYTKSLEKYKKKFKIT